MLSKLISEQVYKLKREDPLPDMFLFLKYPSKCRNCKINDGKSGISRLQAVREVSIQVKVSGAGEVKIQNIVIGEVYDNQ